jgi:ABC-type antimicrobial peptide transport system permease subunit
MDNWEVVAERNERHREDFERCVSGARTEPVTPALLVAIATVFAAVVLGAVAGIVLGGGP